MSGDRRDTLRLQRDYSDSTRDYRPSTRETTERDSIRETQLQRDSTRNSRNQTEDQPERKELPETRYMIQRDQTENKERAELWRHITVTHVGRAFPHPVASRST